MSTNNLDPIAFAAALAEIVYHRATQDRPLAYGDLGAAAIPLETTPVGLKASDDGTSFYSPRGFVGQVVAKDNVLYVVIRGTDLSASFVDGFKAGLFGGLNQTAPFQDPGQQIDPGDIADDLLLGVGTTRQTQLDDALALTEAVKQLAATQGKQVIVVGQSLGGGLAGLVSAIENVKGYVFDPAPFENQLYIVAELRALAGSGLNLGQIPSTSFIDNPLSLPIPTDSTLLAAAATLAAEIVGLLPFGKLAVIASQAAYLLGLGNSASDILNYFENVFNIQNQFNANLSDKLTVTAVTGEFLSSGALGGAFSRAGAKFPVDRDSIDVGVSPSILTDDTAVSLHSPTLISLLLRTRASDSAGKKFEDLLKGDEELRYSFFEKPGISGPIEGDRPDTTGGEYGYSGVKSGGAAPGILYRELWRTVGVTDGFYDKFYARFGTWLSKGAVAQGLNPTAQTDQLSLHSGVVKLGLQVVRDALGKGDGGTIGDVGLNVFGAGDANGPSAGYVRINLSDIHPNNVDPTLGLVETLPNSSLSQEYGVRDINVFIEQKAEGQFGVSPNSLDLSYLTSILGATQAEILNGTKSLRMHWGALVVQAGDGTPLNYDAKQADGSNGADVSQVIIGGAAGDNIKGSSQSDYIVEGNGDNTIDGGGGNDIIIGGWGRDTLNAGGNTSASDSIIFFGGRGVDAAVYGNGASGVQLTLAAAELPQGSQKTGLDVAVGSQGRHDTLIDVEKVKLSDGADTVRVNPGASKGLKAVREVDAGEQQDGTMDVLDLTALGRSGNFENNKISGTNTVFKNFEDLKVGGADKVSVNLKGPDAASWKQVDFVNTQGIIDSDVRGLTINFGNANGNVVKGVGYGTIINYGTGSGNIYLLGTNNVLVNGFDANDIIANGDDILHGGIGSSNSETGWVTNAMNNIRYGINVVGDLVIRNSMGQSTYVSNYKGGPGVPFSEQTAGIFIGIGKIWVERLMELSRPFNDTIGPTLKAGNALFYTMTGMKAFPADPLVLDLNGDGFNLTAVSSAAPMFDVFGTGFSVRTGWVQPTDGILAIDKNGNGNIDDVSELIGGESGNGFATLAQYDTNDDGVIDANDAVYSQLRVWQDANGNAVVDPGELKTLSDLGIASINVSSTAQNGMSAAGNSIEATGTFTWANGTTGSVGDVVLTTDPFHSEYKGDKSVSAAAAAKPDLKGYGTLTDLHVAMTLDPTLIDVVNATLPLLTTPNLPALREAVQPILDAWARAVKLPDANGVLQVRDPSTGHQDMLLLMKSDPFGHVTVLDFIYSYINGKGHLVYGFVSGAPVKDAAGSVIEEPSYQQVLNSPLPAEASWQTVKADQFGFIERFTGQPVPTFSTDTPQARQAALASLSSFVTAGWTAISLEAVRISMQSSLAQFFPGIVYDTASNSFHATTDQQLTPMYQAIFRAAPADAGATAWLANWKPIIDVVLGDFARGEGLTVNYAYEFTSMVRAYESVGLPLSIEQAAETLGVPAGQIVEGGSVINGATDNPYIYYLHGGDQTVTTSSGAPDNFVMGGTFGHVVINADRGGGGEDDLLRFTNVKSTDVTAVRDGIDLVLSVNGTNEQIRIVGEFVGIKPSLTGGNMNDKMGVQQIAFSDGVVWDKPDISWATWHPNPTATSIVGTMDMDILDGGQGTDQYLSGGDGGDVYIWGRGSGHDTVDDRMGWILNTAPDYVKFGPGITLSDLTWSRQTDSPDLTISIKGASDTLTILNQFAPDYGVLGPMWLNRIEEFTFDDGTTLSWENVIQLMDQESYGKPAIYGFSYADTLDGGPGVHWLSGGNENDTYLFDFGYNYDVVHDGTTNILGNPNDTIKFGESVRPQDVTFSQLAGTKDLVITLSDGSVMVVAGEFSIDIFAISWNRIENFQFADGTVITFDQLRQQLLNNQEISGSAVVLGTDLTDTIDGGPGNQYLAGGSSDDTYMFGHGSGHDTIDDQGGVVSFKSDVGAGDLVWSKLGNDLLIKIKGSNDSLTILGEFGGIYGDYSISAFNFADGTSLSRGDVYARLYQGGADSDSFNTIQPDIHTGLGHPLIHGGAGDDVITGAGGDTIQFNVGDGRDVVADPQFYYGGQNTISFGADITPDMVQIHQLGTSMIFTFTGTNDRIAYIDDQGLGFPLANIVFANGTTWSTADIQSHLLAGVSLTASQVGGGIEYDYNLSQGYASVVPSSGQSGVITVRVSGILPADVDLQRVRFPDTPTDEGAGILLSAKGSTSGGLLIDNPSANLLPFDQLVFDDGTVWTRAQVQQMLLDQAAATPGNHIIYGFAGNDVITSGPGDDVLEGTNGNDTYVYRRGDGSDKIIVNNAAGWGYVNTLSLPDIASTEVSLLRWPGNGRDDLVVQIDGLNGGPQGQVIISGEFNYGSTSAFGTHVNRADAPIQQIVFADGVVWSETDIEAKLLAQEQAQVAPGGAVYGFDGADTLYAGTGVRTLVGGLGSDTYVWTAGDGPTFISDQGSVALALGVETNTLDIKGVAPSAVTIARSPDPNANDLVLMIAGQAPIVLKGQTAASTTNVVARVSFDDGTVWDWTDLLLRADGGVPTTPDGVTARVFDGSASTLSGTSSDDTYFWGGGHGDATIAEGNYQIWQKADVVRLVGLNAADVDLGIRRKDGHTDLAIVNRATGETLTVVGHFNSASDDGSNMWSGGGTGIERLIFADGTIWNTRQILEHSGYMLAPGDTTVYNLDLSDHALPIYAAPGATLIGRGEQPNTYIWRPGAGSVIIQHLSWDAKLNTLRLQGVAATDVRFEYTANELVVRNVATGDTIKVPSQVPDYGAAGGIDRVVLDDGTAFDLSRSIYFGRGSGAANLNLYGSVATVQLGAGITAQDVYFQNDASGNLMIKFRGDSADSITLRGDLHHQTWGVSSTIQQLKFSDGSVLGLGQPAPDQGQPFTFTWFGSASVTNVEGSSYGVNIFEVAPGGDHITFGYFSSGNVIDFGPGDGQADVSLNSGQGVINLDALPSGVSLWTIGNDLFIGLGSGGYILTIHSYLNNANGITAVKFADGTVWDRQAIASQAVIRGTAGNDFIDLPSNGATVVAGQGDDTLSVSGSGSDRIVFAKGDGHDTLTNSGSGSSRDDTLVLTDINPSDIRLTRNGEVLTLAVLSTGDTFTARYQFWGDGSQILGLSHIQFADGTIWDRATIASNALVVGTPGNDNIDAPTNGATIDLGLGDDRVNLSGTGADRVLFAKGDGHDMLDNSGSGYQRNDTLELTDILPSEVVLTRSDSQLLIQVPSTGDSVVVRWQFYSDGSSVYGINYIKFADGTIWDRSTIAVNAPVRGTAGNDSINAPADAATIIAGLGDDTVTLTGTGADRIVFAKGDGHDTLNNSGSGYQRDDTLDLTDILPSEVQLNRSGDQMIVKVPATGDSVTVLYQFYNGGSSVYGINRIKFADGTIWDRTTINQNAVVFVPGYEIVLGSGNQLVNGDGKQHRYVYSTIGGNDVINDANSQSTLAMQDIASTGVTLSRDHDSWDLVLTVTSTGKTVTIKNEFSPYAGGLGVGFSDGVSWTTDQIEQKLLDLESATNGGSIYGYDGRNDTLVAGLGEKYLNGKDGTDTYVYTSAGGNDVVEDNGGTLVMQDIASSGVTLSRTLDSWDLVLTVTSTGKTVTIKNEFSPYNNGLGVNFSDGNWTRDQIEQKLLDQASAANGGSIYGFDGRNDTLVAGLGDKYLNGKDGTDTYVYTSAGGNDVIEDNGGTLVMQDIASTGVTLSRDRDSWDLVLTVTSTGKTVMIKNEFSPYNSGLGVNFTDGSWTRDQIEQELLDQASAANGGSIYGFDGRNDTLVAGLGDKYLNGKDGVDTYVYTSAGGNDVVDDNGGTLVMQDLASAGVTLSRNLDSWDLVLTVTSTGKTVTIKNEFSPYNSGLGVNFSDGSWTRDQIEQKLLDQASAANGGSIYGFDGRNDTLVAGLGDKYLNGKDGTDTYIYTSAGGNDVVDDNGGSLVMQDIASSGVTLSSNPANYDVTIAVTATGKTVTLKSELSPYNNGLGISFSDGVSWTRDQVRGAASTFTWVGSTSNATLTGNAYGTNVFQFGGGTETANGGARSNFYQVSSGTGQAAINLPTATGSRNELDFVGGINDDQLWFERSGDNLSVDLLGTNTSVTINGWFSGAGSQLQEITAGGLKIDSQVSQLVQAMATYAAANPGFDPTSSSVHTVPNDASLQSTMSAAWHA
ncbi:calcium-binding protein [Bradyrhizobium sp. B120]|uniref:calcium-binding protein n=1 Tax=Bradyrhizobium sp. B120 TaxID=3410088 RepID=UPI003B97D70B